MNEDKQIIEKCLAGQSEAFGGIYDRYAKKLYNFIYYRVTNKEIAEDLLSAVFVKALEKLSSWKGAKGSFSSWLYAIARNQVIDYYRAKKENTSLDEAGALNSSKDLDFDIGNKMELEKIRQELDKLKPEQREIIMMRVWDELSYEEIAAILGKSENACKMAFSRALRELRTRLPLMAYLMILIISRNT